MKQEDCYVLQQAVENKRDNSIANIKERFDRNPFNIQMDICKEQILAEAQYLFRYLEDVNTHENVNAMEKRQKLQWGVSLAEKEINKITKELKDIQNLILEEECPICLRRGIDKCHD